MKIECISKSTKDLPSELLKPEVGIRSDRTFSLGIGKRYVVYAITVFCGHVWFYICDEDYTYYPIWNPSALFRVVDPRLSSHWQFGFFNLPKEKMPIIAFREWIEDPFFYDKLTDGEDKVVRIFKRYKELLDSEFEAAPKQTSGVSKDLSA